MYCIYILTNSSLRARSPAPAQGGPEGFRLGPAQEGAEAAAEEESDDGVVGRAKQANE